MKPLSLTLTALSHSTKPLSLTALSHRHCSLSPSPLSSLSLTVTALCSLSHHHFSLSLSLSPLSALSLSQLSALTLSPSLSPLSALFLSPLSHRNLTEISLPNPKSLSSLRYEDATRPSNLSPPSAEIGASEALSRHSCSPHPEPPLDSGMNVDYRTIPQKDVAKFCTGEKVHRLVDVALVFIGKELQSSAISGNEHEDPTLLHLIKVIVAFFVIRILDEFHFQKVIILIICNCTTFTHNRDSFSRSNFSTAFPLVVASEESSNMEDSLVTGFTDHCRHSLESQNVDVLESCTVDGYRKLANLQSAHDYLVSRVEKRQEGQTDLIILCSESYDSSELDGAWSEGMLNGGGISNS
ncbi:hypothetical protein Syun_028227 [Stephania yunnanensis]|uniref:Uncharacterized protein n=1 Tax=Stephania yunnanensis TaxID=152371 RepID=A0AAP0HQX7_9MAGN